MKLIILIHEQIYHNSPLTRCSEAKINRQQCEQRDENDISQFSLPWVHAVVS